MTTGRLSKGLVALTVAGVAVLGSQAPALAQGAPEDRPCGQGNGNPPQYPPGQQKKTGSVDDSTPNRGQQVNATSGPGAFDPGSNATACMHSTPIKLGVVPVGLNGAASISFTVPPGTEPGLHHVSFNGFFLGQPTEVNVPFTVAAAAAPGNSGAAPGQTGSTPGQNRGAVAGSRLPRTGADHIPELTTAGLVLVAVGGGVLVASRRRREQAPGMPA